MDEKTQSLTKTNTDFLLIITVINLIRLEANLLYRED